MSKLLKRLKNKKVALAVASGFIMILVNLGVIGTELSEQLTEGLNILLSILVSVGILTNPDEDNSTNE